MVDRDEEQLKRLIKRAKELRIEEEKSLLRKRLEGQLLKFTNVVKGYQYRWCVVDPDAGTVEYYEKEDHKRSSKPRGVLNLTYASVCPSDEDSQAFVINAANGDFLKLKAADAKERQFWVNRIRAVAEYHSEKAENNPTIATILDSNSLDSGTTNQNPSNSLSPSASQSSAHGTHFSATGSTKVSPNAVQSVRPTDQTTSSAGPTSQTAVGQLVDYASPSDSDAFPIFCPGGSSDPRAQLRELFRQLEVETHALDKAVDSATVRSPELTAVYKTLLLSKATSQATLSCLKRCLELIKRREVCNSEPSTRIFWPNADGANESKSEVDSTTLCVSPGSGRGSCTGDEQSVGSQESRGSDQWVDSGVFPSPILNMDSEAVSLPVLPGDAQPDDPFEETELGSIEQQKHVVLHLLSQLKLGMDLTKIVLPTFILEKRSILEMFADYLAHPDLFVNINRGEDPEARMIAFVQWYLTAFHAGRKDKIAKKPYNPIIGESFHCCWPISSVESPNSSPPLASISTSHSDAPSTENTNLPNVITYCAEQVSHHPPVTAFHIELPSEQMELNCFVHAKSKFQGMSVSVTMLGKTVLRLGHRNEEYHFAFPTAYARSILTVPWVELGDRVTITCPQTGYSACVIFHTKPIRSNKLHRVSAEIYAPQAADASAIDRGASPTNLVVRVSGEWNSILEFEKYTKGGKKWSIDVNTLKIMRKHVRPIDKQRPEESRRLWQHVTNALRSGNLQLATEKKRELEERQRVSEKFRARHRIPFPVKYFQWDGTSWIFRRPDVAVDPS
ncbi:Oxysterol-binding protein- protein 10 [Clonorchis sinensis]|uniref:Oxysterol-binding protein n=2 Tax=Clonorchis sinensis TaxID=79923 RepID=G7YVH1_CLOSI|nr:Oxysterol-binding protein- protein 10 [Clonorchis sinensis]GAA56951.1 oxysterol-binding protein-related protein 10 [Clonorchis sinensis]